MHFVVFPLTVVKMACLTEKKAFSLFLQSSNLHILPKKCIPILIVNSGVHRRDELWSQSHSLIILVIEPT